MCNEDGTICGPSQRRDLHHAALRAELAGGGHRFKTRSDTKSWCTATAGVLRGLRSACRPIRLCLCINDKRSSTTLGLARDSHGKSSRSLVERGQGHSVATRNEIAVRPSVRCAPQVNRAGVVAKVLVTRLRLGAREHDVRGCVAPCRRLLHRVRSRRQCAASLHSAMGCRYPASEPLDLDEANRAAGRAAQRTIDMQLMSDVPLGGAAFRGA